MEAWIAQSHAADIFIVIAKEERRPEALTLVQQLRGDGLRVDFPLTALKVGKAIQAADQAGASLVILVGEEWPQVKIKVLATRQEEQICTRGLRIGSKIATEEAFNHRGHQERRGENNQTLRVGCSLWLIFQFMTYRTMTLRRSAQIGSGDLCRPLWLSRFRRDHGGVIFIDLRDRHGITQVVFRPEEQPDAATVAHGLRPEDVIQVKGIVAPRLPGTENP